MALFNSVHQTHLVLYIFDYKTEFFLPNQPKNLDPFYKTGLDLEGCFGMEKKSYSSINMPYSNI